MRKVVGRFAILGALAMPLQMLAGNLVADRTFEARERLDRRLEEGADLVYLGDSVVLSASPGDADPRELPAMLQGLMPSRRVAAVAQPAAHLVLHAAFVRYLARQERRPRHVVVPVNLRSFSQEWDPRPEYQYRVQILRLRLGDLLAHAVMAPASSLGLYKLNPIAEEDYLALPIHRGDERVGTVRDFRVNPGARPEDQLRNQIVLKYLYPLKPDHRQLASIREIARVARGAGITPVFYVTPLDVRSIETWAGPEAVRRVAANVALVREVAASEGAVLLDLSFDLGPECFDWKQFPHEHLREAGRRHVTERLRAALDAP